MKFNELNKIPVRTGKKQQVNDISLDMSDFNIEKFNNFTLEARETKGLKVKELDSSLLKSLKYAVGKELLNEADTNFTNGILLEIEEDAVIGGNIILHFKMNEDNKTLIDNIVIKAEKNSKANVIIKYVSDDNLEGYHNGVLRIFAKEDANIKVSKINLLGKKVKNFDSNMSEIEKSANVDFISMDLGAQSTITNYEAILNSEKASADASAVYVGSGSEKIDMNYIMTIRGEKSEANMDVKGALRDSAVKNFKGTLDFKKGAKKSKGAEEEYCMLLSEKSRSRSVPLLLCEEDDVSGEHAAASGGIDENKLFYLMSRGISYDEARVLIINASFNPIVDKIGCSKVEDEVLDYIRKILA